MEGREVIDITPTISAKMAVFPGDQAFSRQEILSFEKGHNLVLSNIHSTVHLGAHTDAPNHYHPQGDSIEKRDLSYYMGKCQIIEVNIARGLRINMEDFNHTEIKAPRVLFKTNSFPDPNQWNNDFNAFSTETIEYLSEKGVRLIGIDTPSVDLADDKDLLSHNIIYKNDMAILEGIVLGHVTPGIYDLLALPLPIEGCDASPVRAVLLK